MAKAFCDEEQKRQWCKDDELDDGKGEERPKDARPVTEPTNYMKLSKKIIR